MYNLGPARGKFLDYYREATMTRNQQQHKDPGRFTDDAKH